MQALVLAAGMGSRLGKKINKWMVNVSGLTLFEHCVEALRNAGISQMIVVTGYNYDEFERYIREHSSGIEVSFVRNMDYKSTNNIWSLYLAKEYLAMDDTILIESDLIFDKYLIKELVEFSSPDVAIVAKLEEWMDGTTVLLNGSKIETIVGKKEFVKENFDKSYKTVNIYKFSKEFLKDEYIPQLKSYIQKFGKNEYYEIALKQLVELQRIDLRAFEVNSSWYEIDTEDDLSVAKKIFT